MIILDPMLALYIHTDEQHKITLMSVCLNFAIQLGKFGRASDP